MAKLAIEPFKFDAAISLLISLCHSKVAMSYRRGCCWCRGTKSSIFPRTVGKVVGKRYGPDAARQTVDKLNEGVGGLVGGELLGELFSRTFDGLGALILDPIGWCGKLFEEAERQKRLKDKPRLDRLNRKWEERNIL